MAGGHKLLEYFILLTVLAKEEVTEYCTWSLQLVQLLLSSHTLPPFSHNPVLPFLKIHIISKCNFSVSMC